MIATNAIEAPHLSMGRVALTVNDLDAVSDFYQTAVGLHLLSRDGEIARLGADDATLLELRKDGQARRRSPREAGLFHTAFLLPTRSDLAHYLIHALNTGVRLAGAQDHEVSEAIYLQDPEGNGIEIYADRPASQWPWRGTEIHMPSEQLDAQDLLSSAIGGPWSGFPPGSTVGHVHLQVGDVPAAEAFYSGVLGLTITCHYPGATFYAADGYHHHVATNIWNSRGAPVRNFPSTGLAELQLVVDPRRAEAIRTRSKGAEVSDPWGTPVAVTTV